ncbi:MAG: cyclic nucleotide-binding/CBS domain-containing protein [Candidatus Woesearchaeota archaeon]
MNKLVRDFMSTGVVSIDKTKPLSDAIKLMATKKISCLVVTDKTKPFGLITERDLIKKILLPGKNSKKLKLTDVMSDGLITIPPDLDLGRVSHLMKIHHIRHLPVVENNKVIGIVTQTDVITETHEVHNTNLAFMKYQNIQSIVIVILFLFLMIYFIWFKFFR